MLGPWGDWLGADIPITVIVASHRTRVYLFGIVFDQGHRAVVPEETVADINQCLSVEAWCTNASLKRYLGVPLFVLQTQYIRLQSLLDFHNSVPNLLLGYR